MIIQTFEKVPVIEADQSSNITFANRKGSVNVYDFDFITFCPSEDNFTFANYEKEPATVVNDQLSDKNTSIDRFRIIVSLENQTSGRVRKNSFSFSTSETRDVSLLNTKRRLSDFHSTVDFSNSVRDDQPILKHKIRKFVPDLNFGSDSLDNGVCTDRMSALSVDSTISDKKGQIDKERETREIHLPKRVKCDVKSNFYLSH